MKQTAILIVGLLCIIICNTWHKSFSSTTYNSQTVYDTQNRATSDAWFHDEPIREYAKVPNNTGINKSDKKESNKKSPVKSHNKLKHNKEYIISEAGKQFIITYEKCELEAYPDLGGGYTIGYGHHGKDVKPNMKITKQQAMDYFIKDIADTEYYAHSLIKQLPYSYKFSQEFYDGLCDLIYNCGVGAVQGSIFYNRLKSCRVNNGQMNQQDYEYTIAAVKTLNAPYKGHKIRRNACHQKMLKI